MLSMMQSRTTRVMASWRMGAAIVMAGRNDVRTCSVREEGQGRGDS